MGKTTFESQYAVGERVYVPELECHCVVQAVWFSDKFTRYLIAYFHDGDNKEVYVFPSQVEKARS